MKAKISKRGLIAIGVASVMAAAAIAIPIGVVYGMQVETPAPAATTAKLPYEDVTARKL